MIKTPIVSVVLPALMPSPDFIRCLSSIRAALENKVEYEIICVVHDPIAFIKYISFDIEFIQEEVPGIYSAMNLGIRKSKGNYLYFIGQDDILLPAAAEAIIQGIENEADLIISDVFWGSNSKYTNNSILFFLVWKNWCHQGLLYNREKFINLVQEYPLIYRVQADHYANIVFSSVPNLKAYKFKGCIAWYSSDGFSSRNIDDVFREAFPGLIYKYFGAMSYYIVIIRRLVLKFFRLMKKI